jgi:hypothetical protein
MPTSKNNRKSLITVNSLNELTDALFEGSLNQRLMRFRSDMAFRGVGDASWDLRTSLMRLGGNYPLLEGPSYVVSENMQIAIQYLVIPFGTG